MTPDLPISLLGPLLPVIEDLILPTRTVRTSIGQRSIVLSPPIRRSVAGPGRCIFPFPHVVARMVAVVILDRIVDPNTSRHVPLDSVVYNPREKRTRTS